MIQFMSLVLLVTWVQAGAAPSQVLSSDPQERRDQMQRVAATATNAGEEVLPVIEAGLRDPDVHVRISAMDALSTLTLRAASPPKAGVPPINLRSRPSLTSAVREMLSDPALVALRGAAVKALPFVSNVATSTFRQALVSRYSVELDDGVRAVVVAELARHTIQATDTQDIIKTALQDPAAAVRRQAALGVARFHPADALSTIVAELRSGNEDTRSEFVYALASYGSQAKPYVGLLDAILLTETRSDRKKQIASAIASINASR